MKNKLLFFFTLILSFLAVCARTTEVYADFGQEEPSTASVTFLPNPELPLPPEPGPNVDPSDSGIGNSQMTGTLPQTGESILSPVLGLIVVLAVLIIWYFRRQLLENKKNKKENNGGI